MEDNKKNNEVIDLRVIFKKILANKKLYFKVLPIVFVLSCAYILCIPRTYTSSLSLAPEMNNSSSLGGTIGSLASSFGFDIGNMETSDAINPMLYPDLMEDNGFVVGLFNIKVASADGEIKCNYYDYLTKYQDAPFWSKGVNSIKKLFAEKETQIKGVSKSSPYMLSKRQDGIAEDIRKNITISIDKKTAVITITAQAQSEAKHEYEKARQLYGSYADANTDLQLASLRSKQEDLENDMQLKYNAYSTMMTQYQAAKAKVQERTPAFTIVKGAAVPVKASGPKRMIFVLSMLFLAFIATTLYIAKAELKELFKI